MLLPPHQPPGDQTSGGERTDLARRAEPLAGRTHQGLRVALRTTFSQDANRCFRGISRLVPDICRASPRAGMFVFECEATFEAEPEAVWNVWTDVARWPEWDVSKEMSRLDGPFEPGVSGWAKQRGNLGGSFIITEVNPGRGWVTECPMPLGKVIFDHEIEPLAGGRVRVVKRVGVQGGFGPLLRLFAPKMRREIAESLVALGRQVSPAHRKLYRRPPP